MRRKHRAHSLLSAVKKCALLALLLALSTACERPHICVENRYLGVTRYASYWVNTPDPHLLCPKRGEELVVCWHFPVRYISDGLELAITLRFVDRTEEQIHLRVLNRSGAYTYQLIGEAFCIHGGILTYKIDAFLNGKAVECWRHQLWCERIDIDETPDDFSELERESAGDY